jgi:putative oxidoreductase
MTGAPCHSSSRLAGNSSDTSNQAKENAVKGDSIMERNALIAARVLMSIIFLLNGLNLVSQSLAAHEMAAHDVPVSLIPLLMFGAQALQLVASIGLIFGIYPRLSALALLLFLIPATLMAHAFWQVAGTSMYTVQLINFLKNVCMAGGLVFVAAAKDQPVLLPRSTHAARFGLAKLASLR